MLTLIGLNVNDTHTWLDPFIHRSYYVTESRQKKRFISSILEMTWNELKKSSLIGLGGKWIIDGLV